eukprot:TRINITY_DN1525_c0_g1_i1.p1 TRINITY_DN1525_c0_g1~~TRINITY_DN1525_c0_g1_i1.p1  ORF type:complete len:213 (+),score=45.28 TRINITY_DN1525_c0_g1_i1:33-671(+)
MQDIQPEIDASQRKINEMQEEANRLQQIQDQTEAQLNEGSSAPAPSNSQEADKRSVYVGNVDYPATPEELQTHFSSCGTINRITILCNKLTGQPKGFAYIEFADEESAVNALSLNEELFRSRPLKILPKRTNVPGMARGGGSFPRGANFPRGTFGFNPYPMYAGYSPYMAYPGFGRGGAMFGAQRGRGGPMFGGRGGYRGRAPRAAGMGYPY